MKRLCGHLSVLAACLLLASCAQTGPPLPPSLELPKPPNDLRASRKGDKVTLAWTEPTRTTDRQTIRYLGLTKICQSTAPEMNECGHLMGTVAAQNTTTKESPHPATRIFVASIAKSIQEQMPTGQVIFAVEVTNRDGRASGLSNLVEVPAVSTLAPPTDLAAQLTGDGVVLTWSGVDTPLTSAGIRHRYRIFRRSRATGKDTIAGEIPVAAGPLRFVDSSFEWEKNYDYRITVVSIAGVQSYDCPGLPAQKNLPATCVRDMSVEGDDSPPVPVAAHDVFAPSVPAGLQAVYSNEGQRGFIDLIWAPVTSADLAGYNIYRSGGNGSRQKLNVDLVKAPVYRDNHVDSGTTYRYSVTSVDVRGNESQPSDEASETAPTSQP